MPDSIVPVLVLAAMSVYILGYGIPVRHGRLRWMVTRLQRKQYLAGYMRNSPYAAIPTGLGCLLMSATVLLSGLGERWTPLWVLAFLAALTCFAVAWYIMLWPPAWFKPEWRREEEDRERKR